MLTAIAYLGAVGLGVTSPQLFRADDGRIYVVKLMNNRLGPKVLSNELLACRLAELLGLCFPPGDVIRIGSSILEKSKRLKSARTPAGLHFASRYIADGRYVVRSNIRKVVNKEQMAGVMLFDHIFHNLDRTWNRRNLIISHTDDGYKIYAIDNSHLFKRGRWNAKWLEKLEPQIIMNYRRAFGWLLKHYLSTDDFRHYIEKVKDITDQQVADIIEEIPQEWLPDEAERQALLRYVLARRNMVDRIAQPFLALLTYKNRGANANKGE